MVAKPLGYTVSIYSVSSRDMKLTELDKTERSH